MSETVFDEECLIGFHSIFLKREMKGIGIKENIKIGYANIERIFFLLVVLILFQSFKTEREP